MLLNIDSTTRGTKHAKKIKRDNNSLTALTDTDISSDDCYFGPLSGLRVVCDTDIDTDWCQIPFPYHPILPLCQKSTHGKELENRNNIDVEIDASKSAIIRKIIEDDFDFNVLREKIRNAKLVTNLAVNLVCNDYIEERFREEMKRRPSVEQAKRPNHLIRCLPKRFYPKYTLCWSFPLEVIGVL